MPFPFKKKSDDIPAPEPMEAPMRKQSIMAKPKSEPELEEATPAGDIGSLGEKYGLPPNETKALAKEIMQHFMGMCGGEEKSEYEGENEAEYSGEEA